jgi:two-component system chemotaxis response regulator CheV
MSNLLDEVDQRTRLAGRNRMELLLFRLHGKQRFGINVFKVKEVIQCPQLTHIPHSHSIVRGVASMRGKTIPVLDLGMAIGMQPLEDPSQSFVIVAEYNRSQQGFLVSAVERIVNMGWDEIEPPPKASGAGSYLTAVTKVDDELVEIIDVEKVLAEIVDLPTGVSGNITAEMDGGSLSRNHVLIADDSSVARNQIKKTLEQLGLKVTTANNGKQALDMLEKWAGTDAEEFKSLLLLISDIEMPEMDGYTLTAEVRRRPDLQKLYILLHTSLSGVFNEALVEQVGANQFIPKFRADDLANAVADYIRKLKNGEIKAA